MSYKQYIIDTYNKLYPNWSLNIENIEEDNNIKEIFGEYDEVTGERSSHRWWDEIEVIQKIGDKIFKYRWAEANRDEHVFELGWSFNWKTLKEVKPVKKIIEIIEYEEV